MGLWDQFTDWYGGQIQRSKEFAGLEHKDIFPGDVSQVLTGTPATQIYGSPIKDPRGTGYEFDTSGGGAPAPAITGTVSGATAPTTTETTSPYEGLSVPDPTDQEALNAIYDPYFASLGLSREQLTAGQPLREEELEAVYTRSLIPLTRQETQERQGITAGQQSAYEENLDALSQVRRAQAELKQSAGAQFGMGSSAGPASMEILARATQQALSNQQILFQKRNIKLQLDLQGLNEYMGSTRTALAEENEIAKKKLQQDFKDDLATILQQEYALESQKAQAKTDIVQQWQKDLFNLEIAKANYAAEIDMFEKQQAANLQTAAASYDPYKIATGEQFRQESATTAPRYVASITSPGSGAVSYKPTAPLTGYYKLPEKEKETDIFGNPLTA